MQPVKAIRGEIVHVSPRGQDSRLRENAVADSARRANRGSVGSVRLPTPVGQADRDKERRRGVGRSA